MDVLLSWPQLVHLDDVAADGTPSSWIQVAKTGTFKSSRYGQFSITRQDLAQMIVNQPAAPTRLPIDYDHLSMDPKKPGDGIAAGWITDLELRDDGDTLWAKVEWTPDGAKRVQAKEYQFVSPSFMKGAKSKADGKEIGTALLAAAVTNHPFLDGMAALALNADQIGQFALDLSDIAPPMETNLDTTSVNDELKSAFDIKLEGAAAAGDKKPNPFAKAAAPVAPQADQPKPNPFAKAPAAPAAKPPAAAAPADKQSAVKPPQNTQTPSGPGGQNPNDPNAPQPKAPGPGEAVGTQQTTPSNSGALPSLQVQGLRPGQRVMVKPDFVTVPQHVGMAFEVAQVVGEGDDAFAALRGPDGTVYRWFRSTELMPSMVNVSPKEPMPPTNSLLPNDAMGVPGAGAEGTPAEEAAETPGQEAAEPPDENPQDGTPNSAEDVTKPGPRTVRRTNSRRLSFRPMYRQRYPRKCIWLRFGWLSLPGRSSRRWRSRR